MDPLLVVSGLAVGILVGLTGVGGGSLMTPLLALAFGVPPAVAVGTDLAFACATKAVGTAAHRAATTVRWSIVGLLCAGALPAAACALAALAAWGPLGPEASGLTRRAIAGSLALTVVALLFRPRIQAWAARPQRKAMPARFLAAATVASGGAIGALVALSSIGAGAVGATLLILLYPRLTAAEVAGTDIAYAVPLTALAAAGHWAMGSIDWALLATLLVGSLPGVALGSWGAKRVPERALRSILAGALAAAALKMAS